MIFSFCILNMNCEHFLKFSNLFSYGKCHWNCDKHYINFVECVQCYIWITFTSQTPPVFPPPILMVSSLIIIITCLYINIHIHIQIHISYTSMGGPCGIFSFHFGKSTGGVIILVLSGNHIVGSSWIYFPCHT